ncbi:MAG: NUDIX domain-containing protein, partial [Candidatus Heimdallarchaeota archaeon]|nr:NUDIX domain-containing protein [Candidatus Heimdallarchaeota archaeon]
MSYPKEFACHFLGVGGVVIHEQKVLLVKLTYGPAKGKWLIPGGLVDCGETLQDAVKREIFEETGVQVQPRGIIGVRSMVRTKDHLTDLYSILICEVVDSPEILVKDELEVSEVRWMPLDELSTNPDVTSYTKLIINKARSTNPMLYDAVRSEKIQ